MHASSGQRRENGGETFTAGVTDAERYEHTLRKGKLVLLGLVWSARTVTHFLFDPKEATFSNPSSRRPHQPKSATKDHGRATAPVNRMVSSFGGSDFSTSFLSLRSMNGLLRAKSNET